MSSSAAITAAAVAIQASTFSAVTVAQMQTEREKCKLIMDQFSPREASITQKQEYAHCVRLVHLVNPADVIILKIVFLIACAGGVMGFFKPPLCGYKPEFSDRVVGFITGFFFLPPAIGVIVALACVLGSLLGF